MTRSFNSPKAPPPIGGYSQAIEIQNPGRILFISGQVPETATGIIPDTFSEQCQLVWANLDAQLTAAGMGFDNLVKITTYLSDRKYGAENGTIRREILRNRMPALTVIIADIFETEWLLEIEAIAVEE